MTWLAIKLFLGGALGKVWAFLKHASLWQLVSIGLAVYCGLQFVELKRARAEAAKWHNQFTAEHNGRIADRNTYQQAQAEAATQNKARVAKIETQQQKVTTDVEADYQRKLAAMRSELLAQPSAAQGSSGSSRLSQVPATAGGPGQASGVSLQDAERLRAAENELQLDELISWVEQQSKVDPNKP